mgnify:CR=1 FL=1
MEHHELRKSDLLKNFPWEWHKNIWPEQEEALEIIAQLNKSVTLEMPTGSGKTAVGMAFLKTLKEKGEGPLFYIAPTKTIVEQVAKMYPDPSIRIAFGRHEHECFYYPGQNFRADEIPCLTLMDCIHRVDQATGNTMWPGAERCPYYQQKFEAKQAGGIVVCTFSFYLFTQLFQGKDWPRPAGLVIDEAHSLAEVVRNSLSYEITDYHLWRSIDLLKDVGGAEREVESLEKFAKTMIRIVKRRKNPRVDSLLEDGEISEFIEILEKINSERLMDRLRAAVKSKGIDPLEKREVLKKLETLVFDLRHYIHSLEYSIETKARHPLNYTYAYLREELTGNQKVQHKLVIKAYYVSPLIKKYLLSPRTVAFSATIGDPQIFGYETGIKSVCYSFSSRFPVENTRIFLPTDTPNLAVKSRSKGQPTRGLRHIASACQKFARHGFRSMVVVVSEKERVKFLELSREVGLNVLSYGDGVSPKGAAQRFKDGEGDTLVGTVANYGEGVDLPKRIAPVTFFLRPAYPNPNAPETQFEERRFRGERWKIWNWRVMVEALQVRGRNIRSDRDLGVTFFISQQFRRFLYAAMPKWLETAYVGGKTFDECVKDSLELLEKTGTSKKELASV